MDTLSPDAPYTPDVPDVLANARLTEVQVQQAIAEFLLKSEELKQAIEGKRIKIHVTWQTSKWSDPNALVHVYFTEDTTIVEEEAPVADGDDALSTEDDLPADEPAAEEE